MLRERMRKCYTWIAALLLIFVSMAQPVLASGDPASLVEPRGTLVFQYVYERKPVVGIRYDLYQVATLTRDAKPSFTSDYWTGHIQMNEHYDEAAASVKKALAETMAYGLFKRPEIRPIASTETDENGDAIFEDLPEGYYLAVAENKVIGDNAYRSEPTIVKLVAEEGEEEFSVIADAKFVGGPKGVRTTDGEHSVRKVWSDVGAESSRPTTIEVQLVRNGSPYGDRVILSEENNWSYHWTMLEVGADLVYSVVEMTDFAQIGYRTISNTNEETLVTTITNEKSPEGTPTPTPTPPTKTPTPKRGTGTPPPKTPTGRRVTTPTPKPERLPQTGVMWLPVPILFVSGLTLYTIGYIIEKKKKS